jgi:hypothetical protein
MQAYGALAKLGWVVNPMHRISRIHGAGIRHTHFDDFGQLKVAVSYLSILMKNAIILD